MPATTIFLVPFPSAVFSTQEPKTGTDSPVAPGGGNPTGPGDTAAPGGAGGTPPPAGPCALESGMMLPLGLFLALMYFMVLRPENKRRKETQAMLSTIKAGDKVVTTGGLHGLVHRLDERTVTLVVDTVKMTFDRAAIGRVDRGDAAAADKPTK